MADLRRAATLNHLCPSLCTRVRVGDTTLVEVRWGSPALPAGPLVMHPCAFRMRVTEAWDSYREGRRLRLLGLPHDPVVDVVPAVGGATWLSGIVRVPQIDQHGYFLTTTLAAGAAEQAGRPVLREIEALATVDSVGVFGDVGTGVTTVQVDAGPTVGPVDEHVLVDLLEQLASVFVAAELIDDLELTEPG
jgi:hypothetical protein